MFEAISDGSAAIRNETHAELQKQIEALQAAKREIEHSRDEYHNIFDNAVEGIFQTTADGAYLKCNRALAEMYGYESVQDLTDSVRDIKKQLYVDPASRPRFVKLMREQDKVRGFEAAIYRRDGSTIWISETARAVRDDAGNLLYYEGFVKDITSRKTAELALRESEERYALALRGANDGIWDWNLRTGEIYFSSRWIEMLGIETNELTGEPTHWFQRIHPDDLETVQAAILAHRQGLTPHLEIEHRMRHKDGRYRWMLVRGLAIREDGVATRMAGSQSDITERKVAEEQLLRDALHDGLTALPNRALFLDRLERSIARCKRNADYLFAVLFLDMDRFKVINDSLGHMIGDQLLIAFAGRLSGCLRPGDTVARLGGDEFTILLDDIKNLEDATRVADRILSDLRVPFALNGHDVFTTTSIGIALSSTGYDRPQDLLRDADTAMYRAKAMGKCRHQVFDTAMHARAVKQLQIENDLRRAIERNEFEVHYQPIVNVASRQISGFEALVRWRHPEKGLISPNDFIPIAEETGLITSIGRWVLREACRQTAAWQRDLPDRRKLTINVNLSGKQFAQPDLVEQVQTILLETGLSGSNLILEITESVIMDNTDAATAMLNRLKALDIQVNIDDFGTGYSSLAHLQRFPVDTMKIDRSFISKIDTNPENAEIVRTIITLAHNLNMKVTAEGIETQAQLEQLRTLKCEHAQGYLLSRPLTTDDATAMLRDGRILGEAAPLKPAI